MRNAGVMHMDEQVSLYEKPLIRYELKEEHEKRYISYLKKRYGQHRANVFIHTA